MTTNWILNGTRNGDKALVWLPSQEFATKREAMTALNAQKKPKTPIYRIGRTYVFSAQD